MDLAGDVPLQAAHRLLLLRARLAVRMGAAADGLPGVGPYPATHDGQRRTYGARPVRCGVHCVMEIPSDDCPAHDAT
jgi:hypothetical protein